MELKYTTGFDGYNAYTRQVHEFDVEIFDKNYSGDAKVIQMGAGAVEVEYSNRSRDSFPTLIPSFLDMNLIATEAFSFNEMYTDDEKALKVVLKMDGKVYGNYFVVPDGTVESFIDPPYDVSVSCTDGLGILSGYNYPSAYGKASVLEVIAKCLNQLGLGMNINTYSDIHYSGLGINEDVFLNTIINQEAFADDDGNPDDCEKVLESLLSEWVSGLVQMDGEWYLFRWPDVVRKEGSITFKRYDYELNYINDNARDMDGVLGTNEGDIIHCNADQIRAVNMPYKRVSVKYDYGFLLNLLDSQTSSFSGSPLEFYGWNKAGGIDASPSVFEGFPAQIRGVTNLSAESRAIGLKNGINIESMSRVRFELTFSAGNANGVPYIVSVWDGNQFLRLTWDDKWVAGVTNNNFDNYIQHDNGSTKGLGQIVKASRDFELPPDMPPSAYLTVSIFPALYFPSNVDAGEDGLVNLYLVKIMPLSNSELILSETHIVENAGNYTKIPDTIEVLNGETDFYGYKGAMFKSDGITLTDKFKHRSDITYVDFLELAAKDILFQHGRPMGRYEGSTIGVFPFLSRLKINSLNGKFMPVSMRVNLREGISRVVLSEVSNEPIPHTVKPVEYEYEAVKQEGVKYVQ